MKEMRVSLAQMTVTRARPEENLKLGEAFVAEAARRGSDVICFPEMWTSGFDWEANKRLAPQQEHVLGKIAALALRHKIWINGSMLAMDDRGRVTNTSILFDPQGRRAGVYRKVHLFSLIHENKHLAPGNSLCVVNTPWGHAGLAICYDIRFPDFIRTYALKGVKILFVPAAFPNPRQQHWKVLLRARAIENQMFVIATNQVGLEDLGPAGVVTYFGSSAIIDPWGETIIEAEEMEEKLLTATIDIDRVDEIRASMPVLKDRRPELYELR